MRIVFMGTPDFAVPCLGRILEDGHTVCGVFTQPDKPRGRGHQLAPTPVKAAAEKRGIPVFEPKTLRDDGVVRQLRQLAPDVIAVVAYGKILPPAVLQIPAKGCVNVHASLLPRYRGAGPIQWSIINGEKETGITTMFMAEGLDTGDMILKEKLAIGENETFGELHDRLMPLGAELLSRTLVLLGEGTAPREKQEDSQSTYAPMIEKSMGKVDWHKPAARIHDLIRGLNPSPGAYTLIKGKKVKLFQSRLLAESGAQSGALNSTATPADGEVVSIGEDGIRVCCADKNDLLVQQVQPEGKKIMSALEFCCGHRLAAGCRLGE